MHEHSARAIRGDNIGRPGNPAGVAQIFVSQASEHLTYNDLGSSTLLTHAAEQRRPLGRGDKAIAAASFDLATGYARSFTVNRSLRNQRSISSLNRRRRC